MEPQLKPERLSLASHATSLAPLQRIEQELGVNKLYCKFDDETGSVLSGNKVRKLEYILKEAIDNNFTTVFCVGAAQSNFARSAAISCARVGLKCELFLYVKAETPKKGTVTANLLLDTLAGAKVHFLNRNDYVNSRTEITKKRQEELESEGEKVMILPEGGSNATGCWGYIDMIDELKAQSKRQDVNVDNICVAVGSGGTLAGIVLGCQMAGLDTTHIWGIVVCNDAEHFKKLCRTIYDEFQEKFGTSFEFPTERVHYIDKYIGEGYSIPFSEELDLIKLAARKEGVFLDPVYGGKAFYGTCDLMRKKEIPDNETVIFINTGGIFGLLAQYEQFQPDFE